MADEVIEALWNKAKVAKAVEEMRILPSKESSKCGQPCTKEEFIEAYQTIGFDLADEVILALGNKAKPGPVLK